MNQISARNLFFGAKQFQVALGVILIIIGSILLGIWATNGTIAMRNILLVMGAILSFIYGYNSFRYLKVNIPLSNWTPLILLGLMFCWVIFHYFFLSRFPEIQLRELTSTWLRSFLAAIFGFGVGLAILKNPNMLKLLWLGIFLSFVYLLFEYAPLAIATKNIHYHGYDQFIYPGKAGAVLMGTIFLGGSVGHLMDILVSRNLKWVSLTSLISIYLMVSTIILYSYVFVLNTQNGVAFFAILAAVVVITCFLRALKILASSNNINQVMKLFILAVATLILLGYFGSLHEKNNSGWKSFFTNVGIAIRVNDYSNWQNPKLYGYPKIESGQEVTRNTYERFSWATAGLTIFLPRIPFGLGILENPFTVCLKSYYASAGEDIPSSHSSWVDFALAFGYPGLIFMLGSLIYIFVISFIVQLPFPNLSRLLSFSLILIYAFVEVRNKHGIEILCFWISSLSALQFQALKIDLLPASE